MAEIYDLVVIGAGSAGLPCAIRAAQRGLSVLVVEKDTEVGGTLHLTAGHLSAGGTQRQQQKGIEDSAAEHWADVQRISHGTTDEAIAKKAVELAPATINWLEELSYPFHEKAPLLIYGHEAYSKPRTYFGADDYFGGPIMQPGKAVLNVLLPVFQALVAEGKIELLLQHSLQNLLVQEGKVIGAEVLYNNERKQFFGKKMVLTTGGYASNPTFFKQHVRAAERLVSTAKTTSTADGIEAAISIGAVFHGAEKHISTLGGIETEPGSGRADFWSAWARVSNGVDRKQREIYINEEGHRFMNEYDATVHERERLVLQQPHQRFYVVFDEASLNDGPCVVVQWNAERFKEEAKKEKCCWAAATIEELAAKINVPVAALKTTVERYNGFVAEQEDVDFGRTYLQHTVKQAPFYALLVYASSLISFGGIKVNENLQVVDVSGKAIEGLYAAGEILGAGATSGNAFCGGMVLTPALSFGKWLGETV
jgi:succinate dehydrogenase/fumarate reductase flavoprotein subunit